MAALQGANIPGADKRCLDEGVSSRSAFIRVAKSGDSLDDLYLDLHVPATPFGIEPINTLQTMYDDWKATSLVSKKSTDAFFKIYPNPTQEEVWIEIENLEREKNGTVVITDLYGKVLSNEKIPFEGVVKLIIKEYSKGVYFVTLKNESGILQASERLIIK